MGVGTINPVSKLEIYNTAAAGHLLLSANDNPTADKTRIDIDFKIANRNHTVGRISSIYEDSNSGGSGGLRFYTRSAGILNEKMHIDSNGNVGIGTPSPDEKLTVKGKIHTQEVRVDLNGAVVPDYVFASDYKLKSLKEVECFIKQYSHLPEIPSAKEIEKNGLMLAEMNMRLLKKIEELTLYAIEQNKIILEQNKRLDKLEEKKNN